MAKSSGRSTAGATRTATSDNPDGVEPESRARRFMRSALEILGETGRTDFTVLEVVERSKTSLRSFYQHFSTKDELLLALIDKIMTESTRSWRAATADLAPVAALRMLIDRICTPAETTKQDKVNRGLTNYNDRLAETLPREYARVLSPLHELIKDIINRGIADGSFRDDIDVDATAALIMQTALGAMRLQVLGAELSGVPVDADHIYQFCVAALRAS
jgi:AcrR family transcriptional regulator